MEGSPREEDKKPLAYGDALWFSLEQMEHNTKRKGKVLAGLKAFFSNYKRALDSFAEHNQKSLDKYSKDLCSEPAYDTLTAALDNVQVCLNEHVRQIKLQADLIQNDLVGAMDLYLGHYQKTNESLLAKARTHWFKMHEERTNMLLAKENYHNSMFMAQQSTIAADNALACEKEEAKKQEMIRKQDQQMRKAEVSKEEYQNTIEAYNGMIETLHDKYAPLLNQIQDSDDSVIKVVKFNLEKFAKYQGSLGHQLKLRQEELNQTLASISESTDIQMFIDDNKTTDINFKPEEFVPYANSNLEVNKRLAKLLVADSPERRRKESVKVVRQGNLAIVEDHVAVGEEEYLLVDHEKGERQPYIYKQTKRLLNSDAITLDEKAKIIALLHDKQQQQVLSSVLLQIISPRQLQSMECLKLLGDIVKFVLTLVVHEDSYDVNDYKLISAVLDCSQHVFFVKDRKRKLFLSAVLSDHGIWLDQSTWRECIYLSIDNKILDSVARKEKRLKGAQPEKQKNVVKMGFQKLKGALVQKEKQKIDYSRHQNLVFNELSKFSNLFINFSVPYDWANELLVHFLNFYQLDKKKSHLILYELKSNQRNTASMFTEQEFLMNQLRKRSERLVQFGHSDVTQILGETVKFIGTDKELRKILCLSKQINEVMKGAVLKQSLLRADPHRRREKRKQIWIQLCDISEEKANRKYVEVQRIAEEHLHKQVIETIEVDVNRSFNNMRGISSENLNNILRAYAVTNSQLDYCQGMNFIAGFLFLVFGTEPLAFAFLQYIIHKFDLSLLFNSDLPMLKLLFYKLDRLISIILPDLHAHFKDESISSNYFSSSYFITQFTQILQFQDTAENSEKLFRVWDNFLVYGWKAIFKTAIAMLQEYEEEMLSQSFEILMTKITNTPARFLLYKPSAETAAQMSETQELPALQSQPSSDEEEQLQKFDLQMRKLPISSLLLDRLEMEFNESYKQANASAE